MKSILELGETIYTQDDAKNKIMSFIRQCQKINIMTKILN